ncbi:MAG: hypothetical protein V1886_00570 [archaeon]
MKKGKEQERKLLTPGKDNKEERTNFVRFWADYIRTHSDREWSRQQNIIINAQIRGGLAISAEQKQKYI